MEVVFSLIFDHLFRVVLWAILLHLYIFAVQSVQEKLSNHREIIHTKSPTGISMERVLVLLHFWLTFIRVPSTPSDNIYNLVGSSCHQ